jgi:hypothetical protein
MLREAVRNSPAEQEMFALGGIFLPKRIIASMLVISKVSDDTFEITSTERFW